MRTSDPNAFRSAEAGSAVDWLGAHGRSGDEVGVIVFSDEIRALDPVPVRGNEGRVKSALADRSNLGGGTPLGPAFDRAASMLGRRAAATPVVVLISDGVPNATFVSQRTAIEEAVRALPSGTRLHLIAMNGQRVFEPVRSHWESAGLAGIHLVDHLQAGAISSAMAAILSAETGQAVAVGAIPAGTP